MKLNEIRQIVREEVASSMLNETMSKMDIRNTLRTLTEVNMIMRQGKYFSGLFNRSDHATIDKSIRLTIVVLEKMLKHVFK